MNDHPVRLPVRVSAIIPLPSSRGNGLAEALFSRVAERVSWCVVDEGVAKTHLSRMGH
jgi:hypothetical protein